MAKIKAQDPTVNVHVEDYDSIKSEGKCAVAATLDMEKTSPRMSLLCGKMQNRDRGSVRVHH